MKKDCAQEQAIFSNAEQYFTFVLAGDIYAMSIAQIKEIIDYGGITRVPMMPAYIAGVINLRGSVVPVVDLARRFGKQPCDTTKKTSIVILEVEDEGKKIETGVIVDVINEVLDIPVSEIEPTPPFGTKIRTDFISGVGKVNGKLLTLLDVNVVLSIDELSRINEQ